MKKRLKVDPESIYTSALLLIFAAALLYNFSLILTKINPYFIDSDLVNEITSRQASHMQRSAKKNFEILLPVWIPTWPGFHGI